MVVLISPLFIRSPSPFRTKSLGSGLSDGHLSVPSQAYRGTGSWARVWLPARTEQRREASKQEPVSLAGLGRLVMPLSIVKDRAREREREREK